MFDQYGSAGTRSFQHWLRQSIRGESVVGDRPGSAEVAPFNIPDVVAAVQIARSTGVPITAGGGAGADHDGIVLRRNRHLHRIGPVERDRARVTVEAGARVGAVRRVIEPEGFTLPPFAGRSDELTIGAAVDAGLLVDASPGTPPRPAFEELEIVTGDGARAHLSAGAAAVRTFGDADERVTRLADALHGFVERNEAALREAADRNRAPAGYRLGDLLPDRGFRVAGLLSGGRGTLGVVVAVSVRLVPLPASRVGVILGFPSFATAAANAPFVRTYDPALAMLIADAYRPLLRGALPAGNAWIAVEFTGDERNASAAAVSVLEAYQHRLGTPSGVVTTGGLDDAWGRALRFAARATRLRCDVLDLGEFVADLEARARGTYALRWGADALTGDTFAETVPADDATRGRLIDDVVALGSRYAVEIVPGALDDAGAALVASQDGVSLARACAELKDVFDPQGRLAASTAAFRDCAASVTRGE